MISLDLEMEYRDCSRLAENSGRMLLDFWRRLSVEMRMMTLMKPNGMLTDDWSRNKRKDPCN